MFSINEPGWFSLFLFFPVLLWVRYFWRQRGGRIVFPLQIWNGKEFRPRGYGLKLVNTATNALFWLGVALLILAMTGPEMIEREEIHLSRGIDIIIVLDQSLSMDAQDYPPVNRFDMARDMIRRFVLGRKGDSIGLVGFGSQAVLRCPPTADYDWLLQHLDELQLRELGDDTAIGMGIAVAALHLTDSTAKEKVILLLTDGDDNAGEIRLETAVNLVADLDIKVYFIGIGDQGEFPVKLVDEETGVLTSGTIVTRYDEEKFRYLAETTAGGYWKATSPGTLDTVFQAVDSLETVERRVSVRVLSRPIHRPFIIAGIFVIMFVYVVRRILMGETP